VAGVIAAVVFYWRSRRGGRIAYQQESFGVVGGERSVFSDEVSIFYQGHEVPRLTSSAIYVWNSGRRTIRGEDIVERDPLRIAIGDNKRILNANVAAATRDVIDFRATVDRHNPGGALLSFDFMDPGDGARIEVIHTGPLHVATLLGTVRGIPEGPKNWGRAWTKAKGPVAWLPRSAVFGIAALLGILMVLQGMLQPTLVEHLPRIFGPRDPIRYQHPNWILIVFGSVYAAFPIYLLWIRRKRYPSSLSENQHSGDIS
jgi:hypothetical protein